MNFNIHIDLYDVIADGKRIAKNKTRCQAEKIFQNWTGDLFEHHSVTIVDVLTGDIIKERR